MTEELRYEVENNIGRIILNRPHRRNALTFAMYDRIREICRIAGTDDDTDKVKVLIFSGGGDMAFAAGTDISQFRDFTDKQRAIDYEEKIEVVMEQIEQCAVPTIAALNGFVTGGGASVAASCAIRIASTDVKIGVPIARTLGNCLSISGLKRLVALVGEARARYILLTGQLMDATAAQSAGFISETLADKQAVDARAMELAQMMTGFAPLTIKATMEGLRRLRAATPTPSDHDLIEMCFGSEDFKEGISAFFEKRKPDWRGK